MNVPHQAVINVKITAEIMENDHDGKVSGIPSDKIEESKLFTVTGSSLEECKEKTKELMKGILKNG